MKYYPIQYFTDRANTICKEAEEMAEQYYREDHEDAPTEINRLDLYPYLVGVLKSKIDTLTKEKS